MQIRVNVLGSLYSRLHRDEINRAILADSLAGRSGYICVSNVHTTMMGVFNSDYQKITNESLYSVPDGMPLVWAMKFLGSPSQDRVRGPTLMKDICDQGRTHGLKHYLLGGKESTLSSLKKHLETTYPGIQIVGVESPPFRTLTPEEIKIQVEKINQSGAQILWVGLGAPKQERWMFEVRAQLKPLALGVGAAFDLLPGIIPEAPLWMQGLGLEWLYRLLREPGRLWKRYVIYNPLFVILLTLQIIYFKFTSKHEGT